LNSSDFGGLANQQQYRSASKLMSQANTVKPQIHCGRAFDPQGSGTHQARNFFAFSGGAFQAYRMTQPLALVLFEKILPGSRVVNRLQDLNYRVQTLADARNLVETAQQSKPLLVLADLSSARNDVCPAIAQLKLNEATKHLPVIGFGADQAPELQSAAQTAGATLVASDAAILNHLPQLLEQALQVE